MSALALTSGSSRDKCFALIERLSYEFSKKKIEGMFDPQTARNILSWLEDDTCDSSVVLDLLECAPEKLNELFGDILTLGRLVCEALWG